MTNILEYAKCLLKEVVPVSQEKENQDNDGYTQREWDRVVGIGEVPEEYKRRLNSNEEKQRRYDRG